MSTVVSEADGREWRVGRRWLPWRPRKRTAKLTDALDVSDLAGLDGIGLLVFAACLVLFLLPLIVLLAVVVAEWLLVLLLLPAVTLARVLLGAQWTVVARCRSGSRPRAWYAKQVKGWRAAGELIDLAAEEIRRSGAPHALGARTFEEPARDVFEGPPPDPVEELRAGKRICLPGHVHGFASPFATEGWLRGYLHADSRSLFLSQDDAGLSARRDIPVLDAQRMTIREATPAEAGIFGDDAVVVELTAGRAYRIAFPNSLVADWLVDTWRTA